MRPGNAPDVAGEWALRWARPFPLDGRDVFPELPTATTSATVVGLAASVRSSRKIVLATHAILRGLATHAGFRAASIEGTDATGGALDRYVTEGAGQPEALVGSSQGFLRTRETVELVRWLREFNVEHPDDPIRVVHGNGDSDKGRLDRLEQALAASVLRWHETTGARIVHLGGTAHTLVGDPRTVSPNDANAHRNAGGYLRAALGQRYQALALTTGAGNAPFPVPAPPRHFTEAVFAGTTAGGLLLDLDIDHSPPPEVARWLRAPMRTRCVGPAYDPANDAEHYVAAGPLRTAVDGLLHVARTTPTTPLE